MTAKDMFNELGFFQYANNKKFICYTGEKESGWKRIKFKLEQQKMTIHSDVNIDMLRAIIKQCEELGWMPSKISQYMHRQYMIAEGLQNEDGSVPMFSKDYENGWNDCIDEILGEE